MRKIELIILFMVILILPLFSDDYDKKVEQYISNGEFSSAMDYLNSIDPDNNDIDIVSLKNEIFLNYFTQSLNHTMFGLKDLEGEETIMQLRKDGGEFHLYIFDAPEVLSKFQLDDEVRKNLIRFYISLDKCYGYTEKYEKPMETAIEIFEGIEDISILGVDDYSSLALFSLKNSNIEKGIYFYDLALKNEPENPEFNYNIAYAYTLLRKYYEALDYAMIAYNNYEDKNLKRDAYLMIGDINLQIKNLDEALRIFQEINTNMPNLFIERKIIQTYMLMGENDLASDLSVEYLLKMQAQEAQIYKLAASLIEINFPKKFIEFSDNSITAYDKNHERNAMIYYYQSYISYQLGENDLSQDLMKKAKDELLLHQETNDDLMSRIENILEE